MEADDKGIILLVDDDPANLTALEALLVDLEHPVLKACSARDALKHLLKQEAAVILLDVRMPEIDGFEAAALIRAREKSHTTPIIFLTAYNDNNQIAQAYSAGAVDYLTKPFDPAVLKAKVAIFVEMASNTRRLQTEIACRQEAEAQVHRLNQELEHRVQERTTHIEALNRRLEQMLAQTHDQVRNNLQILTALIDMQRLDGDENGAEEKLVRMQGHIRVLAIVHDLLNTQSFHSTESPLLPVHDLLQRVLDLMQLTAKRRKLSLQADEAYFAGRPGASLGLIARELCSNALKHGKGEVELTFTLQESMAQLQVCDNGPGFDTGFLARPAARVGLRFIEDLTHHDLRGMVRYENHEKGGARVIITMPHKPHSQAA